MRSFKDMMKFKPPDISVFKKFGRGYLNRAHRAVQNAESDLVHARFNLLEDPLWGEKAIGVPEDDLVEMYAYWTMADDMLKRLDRMEPEEREQQLALDTNPRLGCVFEEISDKHADIDGRITAWEGLDGKDKVYPALDRQMKRRLDTWEKGVLSAQKYGFDEDDVDPFESVGDLCDERTIIEYAALGIENLQFRYPGRMEPLPYLDTFLRRRIKLDNEFRKALRGQYQYDPRMEFPEFWWCYPSSQKGTMNK